MFFSKFFPESNNLKWGHTALGGTSWWERWKEYCHPWISFSPLPVFKTKKFFLLCQMSNGGDPGPGGGSQDQQLPSCVSGQSSSPRLHSLPAEETGLRHLFPQHKAQQGSASTAEGHEAYKPTEPTQILVGETWVLKLHVRDRDNWDKCLQSIAMDLVNLFCNDKVCKITSATLQYSQLSALCEIVPCLTKEIFFHGKMT